MGNDGCIDPFLNTLSVAESCKNPLHMTEKYLLCFVLREAVVLSIILEATGGSSELIIVLNKVGAVASKETLDRHIMKVSECKIDGLALQQIYHQIFRSHALQT